MFDDLCTFLLSPDADKGRSFALVSRPVVRQDALDVLPDKCQSLLTEQDALD